MIKPKTKIHAILIQREMSQEELRKLIQEKTGNNIGADRISRIVNGVQTNYTVQTAREIATALSLTIDEILE